MSAHGSDLENDSVTPAREHPMRPERYGGHLAVIGTFAALNTVGAFLGAWGLMSGALSLGAQVEARLPWESTVVAGLALAVLVGVPSLVLLILTLRRSPLTSLAAVAVGGGLVVWILVQLAIISQFSFFHPVYVAVGLVLIAAGLVGLHQDSGDGD